MFTRAVIPAEAGIELCLGSILVNPAPAFAGVTV